MEFNIAQRIGLRFDDLADDLNKEYRRTKGERFRIEPYKSLAMDADLVGTYVADSLTKFIRSLPTAFKTQIAERIRKAVKEKFFDHHLHYDKELKLAIAKKVNASLSYTSTKSTEMRDLETFMEQDYKSFAYIKSESSQTEAYDPALLKLRNAAVQQVLFEIFSRRGVLEGSQFDRDLKIINILLDKGFNEGDKFVFNSKQGLEQVQALAKIRKIASLENDTQGLIQKIFGKCSTEDLIAAQKYLTTNVKTKSSDIIPQVNATYAEMNDWQKSVYVVKGKSISWIKPEYKPVKHDSDAS